MLYLVNKKQSMKKLFLILLYLAYFIPFYTFANYIPLLDSTQIWYNSHDIYPMGTHAHWEHTYKIGNDTIISGNIYSIVLMNDTNTEFYLREVGQKIYCYSNSSEGLLYDFSALIGDSVKYSSSDSLYQYVQNIDSLLINGQYRKNYAYNIELAWSISNLQ